jgi:hypothetical protein
LPPKLLRHLFVLAQYAKERHCSVTPLTYHCLQGLESCRLVHFGITQCETAGKEENDVEGAIGQVHGRNAAARELLAACLEKNNLRSIKS